MFEYTFYLNVPERTTFEAEAVRLVRARTKTYLGTCTYHLQMVYWYAHVPRYVHVPRSVLDHIWSVIRYVHVPYNRSF